MPVVLSGTPEDLCFVGGYVYVAVGSGGLDIVDVSDESAPMVVKNVPSSNALAVAVRGRYAYLVDSVEGLKVIDLMYSP